METTTLLTRIRGEFNEMPGLQLTPRQAAKIFGVAIQDVRRLLAQLQYEGFLVCDAAGRFRRGEFSPRRPDSRSVTMDAADGGDLLEAIGVELPCVVCEGSYRASLRKIRLSQQMMDEGCTVRHFSDCPPAAFAHLIPRETLAELEAVIGRIESAADGAGGRLVAPR